MIESLFKLGGGDGWQLLVAGVGEPVTIYSMTQILLYSAEVPLTWAPVQASSEYATVELVNKMDENYM